MVNNQVKFFDIAIDALDKGIDTLERMLGYVNLNSMGKHYDKDTLRNALFTEGFLIDKAGKVSL